MEKILLELYKVAASIGSPLAYSSTAFLIFFYFAKYFVSSLETPIKKVTGAQAYRLLIGVLASATIIALVAVAGGLLLTGYSSLYDYINKDKLVRMGNEALDRQEQKTASDIAKKIIDTWPTEPDGYRIKGAAEFMSEEYLDSADSFEAALLYVDNSSTCGIERVNMIANLTAALASSGRYSDAAERFDGIYECELEKGMLFNYAKVLLLLEKYDESVDVLLSERINNTSRPDYRDRVYLELSVAYLLMGTEFYQHAINAATMSLCLNSDIKQIFKENFKTGGVDPPGRLIQSFSMERDILSVHPEFLHDVMNEFREEEC